MKCFHILINIHMKANLVINLLYIIYLTVKWVVCKQLKSQLGLFTIVLYNKNYAKSET